MFTETSRVVPVWSESNIMYGLIRRHRTQAVTKLWASHLTSLGHPSILLVAAVALELKHSTLEGSSET